MYESPMRSLILLGMQCLISASCTTLCGMELSTFARASRNASLLDRCVNVSIPCQLIGKPPKKTFDSTNLCPLEFGQYLCQTSSHKIWHLCIVLLLFSLDTLSLLSRSSSQNHFCTLYRMHTASSLLFSIAWVRYNCVRYHRVCPTGVFNSIQFNSKNLIYLHIYQPPCTLKGTLTLNSL